MAERRMFTKKITDSDAFIELSSSAQALYFHLNQGADDDGFNNQIQNAMFKSHSTIDDLKVLMLKNFIIRFDSGVIVIKHWRMHNTLRKDRYTPTNFQEELKCLGIKDNGSYTLCDDGCHLVSKRLPQDSIGKISIDKDSIDKDNIFTASNDAKAIVPINENQNKFNMEFEKLWEIYPNKKGKAKALTKYILSRKKGTTYEQVYDGINNYIEYIKKNKISSQYIKHGDTYFNNQCWLDEYKDTKVSKNNNDEQWDLLKGVYDGTIKVN